MRQGDNSQHNTDPSSGMSPGIQGCSVPVWEPGEPSLPALAILAFQSRPGSQGSCHTGCPQSLKTLSLGGIPLGILLGSFLRCLVREAGFRVYRFLSLAGVISLGLEVFRLAGAWGWRGMESAAVPKALDR